MSLPSDLTGMLADAGLVPEYVEDLVRAAVEEDLARGVDITSEATVPRDQRSVGELVARADGVVAGLAVAEAAFVSTSDQPLEVERTVADGNAVTAGSVLMTLTGRTRALLLAERTALNLLCHLSGVATLTRRWADALEGTRATVRDTRKTTPGLRALEKYAVRCGGGANHRMGLSDMALVKDNHVAAAGGVAAAFEQVRRLEATIPVEVEVDSLDGLREAMAAGADEVLLDNFEVGALVEAVRYRDEFGPAVRLEASGGLTVETAAAVGATGVDYIAVGELTHSARVLDIGLDLVQVL